MSGLYRVTSNLSDPLANWELHPHVVGRDNRDNRTQPVQGWMTEDGIIGCREVHDQELGSDYLGLRHRSGR